MQRDYRGASDPDLVAHLAQGEERALAELFGRHATAVAIIARRSLGSGWSAEEVVQEVFLRLWISPGRFDPGRGSLRTFLLTEARGRAVDLVRVESARRARELRAAGQVPIAVDDVEREVLHRSLGEAVQHAVSELPARQRRAIELAYFSGASYREVALLLEEPEGTVKARIRSGLRCLHVALLPLALERAR